MAACRFAACLSLFCALVSEATVLKHRTSEAQAEGHTMSEMTGSGNDLQLKYYWADAADWLHKVAFPKEDCVFLVGAFWNIVEQKYPKVWLLKDSKSLAKDKKAMVKDFYTMCSSSMVQSKGFGAEQCLCLAEEATLTKIIAAILDDIPENDICTDNMACGAAGPPAEKKEPAEKKAAAAPAPPIAPGPAPAPAPFWDYKPRKSS